MERFPWNLDHQGEGVDYVPPIWANPGHSLERANTILYVGAEKQPTVPTKQFLTLDLAPWTQLWSHMFPPIKEISFLFHILFIGIKEFI